jgi:hypothetical protein
VRVVLSGANERVAAKLRKAGIVDLVGSQNTFKMFDEALVAVTQNTSESDATLVEQQMAVSEPLQAMLDVSREYFLPSAERRSKGE